MKVRLFLLLMVFSCCQCSLAACSSEGAAISSGAADAHPSASSMDAAPDLLPSTAPQESAVILYDISEPVSFEELTDSAAWADLEPARRLELCLEKVPNDLCGRMTTPALLQTWLNWPEDAAINDGQELSGTLKHFLELKASIPVLDAFLQREDALPVLREQLAVFETKPADFQDALEKAHLLQAWLEGYLIDPETFPLTLPEYPEGPITEGVSFEALTASREWSVLNSFERKVLCQRLVPEEICSRMTTPALLETWLNYPYRRDLFAYAMPLDPVREVARQFLPLATLLERDDALETVEAKMDALRADDPERLLKILQPVQEYLEKHGIGN